MQRTMILNLGANRLCVQHPEMILFFHGQRSVRHGRRAGVVRPDPGRGRRACVPSPMAGARVRDHARVHGDARHHRGCVPVGDGAPSPSAVPRRLLPAVARRPRAIGGRSGRARAGRARRAPRRRATDGPRPRAAGPASPSANAQVRSHCGGADAALAGAPVPADPGHAPPGGGATPVRDRRSRRGLRGTDGEATRGARATRGESAGRSSVATLRRCSPSAAHAASAEPDEHFYTVEFDGRELWGDDAEPGTAVRIDLFESYLEATS